MEDNNNQPIQSWSQAHKHIKELELEIKNLRKATKLAITSGKKFLAENEKLREVLMFVIENSGTSANYNKRARKLLKELNK